MPSSWTARGADVRACCVACRSWQSSAGALQSGRAFFLLQSLIGQLECHLSAAPRTTTLLSIRGILQPPPQLIPRRFNAGSASQTLTRHQTDAGSASRAALLWILLRACVSRPSKLSASIRIMREGEFSAAAPEVPACKTKYSMCVDRNKMRF